MKKIALIIYFCLNSSFVMAQESNGLSPIAKCVILSLLIVAFFLFLIILPGAFSYRILYSRIIKNAKFNDQDDYGYFDYLENGQPKKMEYLESDLDDFKLILPNDQQIYDIEYAMVEFRFLGIKYKSKESIVHINPENN